jgi:hypothetical protein
LWGDVRNFGYTSFLKDPIIHDSNKIVNSYLASLYRIGAPLLDKEHRMFFREIPKPTID